VPKTVNPEKILSRPSSGARAVTSEKKVKVGEMAARSASSLTSCSAYSVKFTAASELVRYIEVTMLANKARHLIPVLDPSRHRWSTVAANSVKQTVTWLAT